MDINTLAKSIVDQAIGEKPRRREFDPKRVAAAQARAKALGPEKTAEIARKGAAGRWQGKEKAEG